MGWTRRKKRNGGTSAKALVRASASPGRSDHRGAESQNQQDGCKHAYRRGFSSHDPRGHIH